MSAPHPSRRSGSASPFHPGEQAIQSRLGVRERIEPWARRVVRPYLPEEHARFYAGLPFVVAAARDARGRPWATLLAGAPGFLQAPDPRRLAIAAVPGAGDALGEALQAGSDLGLLGIELDTRRRNRVNGRVRRRHGSALELAVDQTFGNCPQHIRLRQAPSPGAASSPGQVPTAAARSPRLSTAQRRWIAAADTFFIASGHRGAGESPAFGMDASHRGGPAGFVDVVDDRTLVFPDYAGNDHFNTLGNLALDPRAGLLFVDFERGGLLQLTGRARIDWDEPDARRFPGARRLVRFTIEEAVEPAARLPWRWRPAEQERLDLRVVRRVSESEDVVSLLLEPLAGPAGERPLPSWRPGQHLPLGVDLGEAGGIAWRSYSISNAPGGPHLRLSIKREERGLVSRWIHDAVRPGDVLRASPPAGDFVLDPSSSTTRPLCLVAAGIGITPLSAMLRALADAGSRRPIRLVHGVRDGAHHPLAAELRDAVRRLPDARLHVRYSAPRPDDVPGRDYDDRGRVDASLLARLLPGLDAEFRLCGPPGFLAGIESALVARGVPEARIDYERF